jgi:hypothetical protein
MFAFQRMNWEPNLVSSVLVEQVDDESNIFHFTKRAPDAPGQLQDYVVQVTISTSHNTATVEMKAVEHPAVPERLGIQREPWL